MTDPSARRAAITREINALAALQIKTVKDSTFMGWDAEEMAAYQERGDRLTLLRAELFHLEE